MLNAQPVGEEFVVNDFTIAPQQTYPQLQTVSYLNNGEFVSVYNGFGPRERSGVFAQRFDQNGDVVGNAFRVNAKRYGSQSRGTVTTLADGKFAVAWNGKGPGDDWGIFARLFGPDGTPLTGDTLVNRTKNGLQTTPAIAARPGGGFVVGWAGNGKGDSFGVFFRRFDANGVAAGDEVLANRVWKGQQRQPAVAVASDDTVVIAWNGKGMGDSDGVFMRRFDANDAPLDPRGFRVNNTQQRLQRYPAVAIAGDDSFVVAWYGRGKGDAKGIHFRRFAADGTPIDGEQRANTFTRSLQAWPSLTMEGNGSFLITWSSNRQDGSGWGVFGQEFDANGEKKGDEFQINTTTAGHQRYSSAATDALGNYVVAWTGQPGTDLYHDVYAQQFKAPGAMSAIASISPANGEEMVNVRRETVVRFTEPVDPGTVTTDSFYVVARGQRVAGRVVTSSTEKFATFYYDQPLPSSTEVRVVVEGDKIMGRDGQALDADGDSQPGGTATADFRTLPLAFIQNTAVTGRILQSNAVGGNGEDLPIEGVTIFLQGRPDVKAVTDANGEFILTSPAGLPAPEFFVVIDGSTATNVPQGFMYPTLGKPFHSVAGLEVPLRTGNGQPFDVYLPLLDKSDIVNLDPQKPTDVGFGNGGLQTLQQLFPNVDPSVWQRTRVTFAPGSAQDDQQNPATQAAIIPVAPDRIPAPLPEFLDPALVISIQAGNAGGFNSAGGATNFDVPAEVEFPNMEGLAPGEKALIFSFDHDAGEWIVVGTGTVSADGLMIESDGGVIQAPGWHFTIRGTQVNTRIGVRDFDDGFGRGKDSTFADELPPLTADEILQDSATLRDFLVDPPPFVGANPSPALRDGVVLPILNRFLNATGGTRIWQSGSLLSNLVRDSSQFQYLVRLIKEDVDRTIQSQASRGYIDPTEIEIASSNLNIFWNKYNIFIPFTLRAVLGGTQGTLACLEGFTANASAATRMGMYRADLRIVIFDDFGVGSDDTYSSALRAMFRLQHRGTAQPFVNRVEIRLPGEVDGSFRVPSQFEDVVIEPGSPTTACAVNGSGGGEPLVALGANAEDAVERLSFSDATGFGSDEAVHYFFEPFDQPGVRGKLVNGNAPSNLVLPPNIPVVAYFYQPLTNRSLIVSTSTDDSGRPTLMLEEPLIGQRETTTFTSSLDLPNVGGLDSDADGVPDVGELTLGLDPQSPDSDGDGINDAAELEQGLNPLDGFAATTGAVANIDLGSAAQALDAAGDFVYAAHGNSLSVVHTSQFDRPIVQGQLQLPNTARDVAVDGDRDLAVVTTSIATQIVDVSDPMSPALLRTVSGFADKVELFSGFAYTASGTALTTIDIESGDVVARTTLPGNGNVTGMARNGDTLFAFVSGSDTVVAVDLAMPEAPQVIGQLGVNVASSEVGVFAGNGVLWLAGSGLRTIDISDPANMQVIQTPSGNQFFTASEIALNGSGLGLLLPDGGSFVQVYDTSDPNNVADLVTQFNLSGSARDVKISRGIGYIAAGSRLEVVNYRSFDSLGQPPTVTISSPVDDVDPNTAGVQVFEGTTVPVIADVTDDVQARDVELLVNGQVVSQDVSFPFDLATIAPLLSAGTSRLDLQVRATDTGGNNAVSNTLTIDVVPDTIPPQIESITPENGGQIVEGMRTLRVRFSESLDTTSIDGGNFSVVGAGPDGQFGTADDLNIATTVSLRDDDQLVQIATGTLTLGNFRLQIVRDNVVDRAGNVLGQGVATSGFEVVEVQTIIQGGNPDIVLVIDVSGSTRSAFGGTSVGDINGDGVANTILDAELASLIVLNQELVNLGLGDEASVAIVAFESFATALDMDPATQGIQLTTSPNADADNNGVRDVEQILTTIQLGGGTNFDSALDETIAVFNALGTPPGEGNLLFLSDGQDGSTITDEVQTLRDAGVNLLAFGVGQGADIAKLRDIDPGARRVLSTNDFIDIILGLGNADMALRFESDKPEDEAVADSLFEEEQFWDELPTPENVSALQLSWL